MTPATPTPPGALDEHERYAIDKARHQMNTTGSVYAVHVSTLLDIIDRLAQSQPAAPERDDYLVCPSCHSKHLGRKCPKCGYMWPAIPGDPDWNEATAPPAPVVAPKERFTQSDGGRASAGYKGQAGDCVVRAIANATGKPYQEVYDAINDLAKHERTGKRKKHKSNARDGVYPVTIRKYMTGIGWEWHPTIGIGTGCKVHLKADELPQGRLVVALSKHYTAVVDGVIIDVYDPSRDGTRCVYGYYSEVSRD